MLRISRLTDYGTVVLAHLECDTADLVSAAEVASATGLAVRAGPVEATTIGNIVVQAIADHALEDHSAARTFVGSTSTVRVFQPRDADRWARARQLFRMLPT